MRDAIILNIRFIFGSKVELWASAGSYTYVGMHKKRGVVA